MFARLLKLTALALTISVSGLSTAGAQDEYTLFESGPVRPVAMSPDGEAVPVVVAEELTPEPAAVAKQHRREPRERD